MMSTARNGAAARSIFNWQSRNKPSLATHLLNDYPPEVELSEYRRLSSADSESPSGLLNDEGLRGEPIADLDLFFERLYSYYHEKGLLCIVTNWVVELLTVTFLVIFIWFSLLVVDWTALRNAKCGVEAVESGQKPCDLAKEAIKDHPLDPLTFPKVIVIGSIVILIAYGLFNFLTFFVQFKDTLKIRRFYYSSLNVTDREIQTTPWPTILEKVVQLQNSEQLCVVKNLSAHDIVMRIMRKENYLIGMLNKGVLAFPIPKWVPGAGPAVNSRANGSRNYLILPKTLEWTLNWCIFHNMFDSKFSIRRDFITNPSLLRKRLVVVGIGVLLLSPCLVIFMLVYLFLRHAEQFYNHPSTASSRRWSNLSKWTLREYNEVDHLFKHRMSNSVVHASDYLKQFPSPLTSIIAKFISFVSGGFAAILLIIAFLDESLLEGHIFGRNLFWYGAIFGAVTALSRAAISDELQVLDPEGTMSLVVQQTHYMPKKWRGKENCDSVRKEFETLFQYTGIMLLQEMASIIITPYLLIFVIPKCVDNILGFISDFTTEVEGVGHVCSFSTFDFGKHGNRRYGSPFDAARTARSSQGKMEKSFLSFCSTYQTWEPDACGRQFLSSICNFRDQQMRNNIHPNYPLPPSQPWRFPQTASSEQGEIIHRLPPREVFINIGTIPDQRPPHSHPYLLDWYYVSSHHLINPTAESSSPLNDAMPFEPTGEGIREGAAEEDERWGIPSVSERVESHMEASTSDPFFRNGDVFRAAGVNHWWARPEPGSHTSGPEASFLEPPAFGGHVHMHGHQNTSYLSENVSERSLEEDAGDARSRDWRDPEEDEVMPRTHEDAMSRTLYVGDSDNDDDGGGFGLHFADDSRRDEGLGQSGMDRPMNLLVKILPRSNDPLNIGES